MTEPIYDYDPAQALDSPEAIAVFIADALDTGDAAYIAKAMGVVARAKGMTEAQYGELLAVIGLAHQNNALVTAMKVPIDPQFLVGSQG